MSLQCTFLSRKNFILEPQTHIRYTTSNINANDVAIHSVAEKACFVLTIDVTIWCPFWTRRNNALRQYKMSSKSIYKKKLHDGHNSIIWMHIWVQKTLLRHKDEPFTECQRRNKSALLYGNPGWWGGWSMNAGGTVQIISCDQCLEPRNRKDHDTIKPDSMVSEEAKKKLLQYSAII